MSEADNFLKRVQEIQQKRETSAGGRTGDEKRRKNILRGLFGLGKGSIPVMAPPARPAAPTVSPPVSSQAVPLEESFRRIEAEAEETIRKIELEKQKQVGEIEGRIKTLGKTRDVEILKAKQEELDAEKAKLRAIEDAKQKEAEAMRGRVHRSAEERLALEVEELTRVEEKAEERARKAIQDRVGEEIQEAEALIREAAQRRLKEIEDMKRKEIEAEEARLKLLEETKKKEAEAEEVRIREAAKARIREIEEARRREREEARKKAEAEIKKKLDEARRMLEDEAKKQLESLQREEGGGANEEQLVSRMEQHMKAFVSDIAKVSVEPAPVPAPTLQSSPSVAAKDIAAPVQAAAPANPPVPATPVVSPGKDSFLKRIEFAAKEREREEVQDPPVPDAEASETRKRSIHSFLQKVRGVTPVDQKDEEEDEKKSDPLPPGASGLLDVDVFQAPGEFVIFAQMPGVEMEDLSIYLEKEKDIVVLKGTRKRPEEFLDKDRVEGKFIKEESKWGAFYRKIVLPEEVDIFDSWAKLDKGVLVLKLPLLKMKDERRSRQKIKIIHEE